MPSFNDGSVWDDFLDGYGSAPGPLWAKMNRQPRPPAAAPLGKEVPTSPGVYAWYSRGKPVYSGRALGAEGLRGRIGKDHLKTGNDLSRSSFRRNVREHLGIATTAKTTVRPTVMTATEVEPVNGWIRKCEVAWLECGSESDAKRLEQNLHEKWIPPLSRR